VLIRFFWLSEHLTELNNFEKSATEQRPFWTDAPHASKYEDLI
jgi:hypothetical protein